MKYTPPGQTYVMTAEAPDPAAPGGARLVRLELPLLIDPCGRPYRPDELPCHRYAPYGYHWDDDAEPRHKETAAKLCRTECPALTACTAALARFAEYASGVWAGQVLEKRTFCVQPTGRHRLPDQPERYRAV